VYKFDGYTFRPATPDDKPLARLWNMMDPDHKWEMQYPDYWIDQNNVVNSYVLQDAIGILFFVKSIRHTSDEIEISLQFDRECGIVSKARVVRGLDAGFAWLKKALPMNGFTTLYFMSKNEDLIGFTEKRMGFVKDGERQIYTLKGTESDAQKAS
jgi:hypothetical protein